MGCDAARGRLCVSHVCSLSAVTQVPLSNDAIIPIYGRGRTEHPSRGAREIANAPAAASAATSNVPARPPGARPASVSSGGGRAGGPTRSPAPRNPAHTHAHGEASSVERWRELNSATSTVSSFFGLPAVFPTGQEAAALSPEQLQQAVLSRLLLLLGSFVILCLLLV